MSQHYDSHPGANDGFDDVIKAGMGFDQAERPGPYGIPAQSIPTKPGLTRRGRAALAVVTVAVVGGGLIWHEANTEQAARDQKDAAALQIQLKRLQLEELRIRNDQKTKDTKAQSTAQAAFQASVDRCVKDSQHLIGKGYGAPSKGDVIADCKQQYGDDTGTAGMENAAASSAAGTAGGSGSGINSTGLLGLVAGGGFLVAVAARRGKRTDGQ